MAPLTPRTVELDIKGDERGYLVALEAVRNVPFDLKRAYIIFGTIEGVRRGLHAHRATEQLAVCVHGKCSFLLDDGKARATIVLDRPDLGLYLGPMLWHEMFDFSADCVLLVLANQYYDESDYIRNYAAFRAMAG
jgi:dTDP-4-dehydrorhamnose 3,5-epimerase-like enzyme